MVFLTDLVDQLWDVSCSTNGHCDGCLGTRTPHVAHHQGHRTRFKWKAIQFFFVNWKLNKWKKHLDTVGMYALYAPASLTRSFWFDRSSSIADRNEEWYPVCNWFQFVPSNSNQTRRAFCNCWTQWKLKDCLYLCKLIQFLKIQCVKEDGCIGKSPLATKCLVFCTILPAPFIDWSDTTLSKRQVHQPRIYSSRHGVKSSRSFSLMFNS